MKKLVSLLIFIPLVCQASWNFSDKKIPEEQFEIATTNGELLNAYLWLPDDYSPNNSYKSVVMVHGCGGVHYKDEADKWTSKYIAGKYKVWGKLLNQSNIMVLMVDSFSTRDNGDVGKGVCNLPSLDRPAKIDPITVRPADIASGIEYLKSRNDVIDDKVGVLGFSNGATSVLALANHEKLEQRAEQLNLNGKDWFDLPYVESFQANTFIALYPGCGLNGYSIESQNTIVGNFETYTETFIFSASNDTSLPSDTNDKCNLLRQQDSLKTFEIPNMVVKVIEGTNHQFDYKENEEEEVLQSINRILSIFETM